MRQLTIATALSGVLILGLAAMPVQAQISISPLATWGSFVNSPTPGWLPPAYTTPSNGTPYAFLGTANNERGIAFAGGNVYLVSRSGGSFIRQLDPTTGADLGALTTTGVSGGTFAVDMAAAGGDGALYVGNLQGNIGGGAYKVYKWAPGFTTSTAPTTAINDTTSLPGARLGDDLAAIGSGSSTRLVAGFNTSPAVAGNNGYAVIDPTAGTSTVIAFSGTPPNAGDFSLGITFGQDANHVLGTKTGGAYGYSSYTGALGTLLANVTLPFTSGIGQPGNTAERLMAYAVIGGIPILAEQSTGDGHVSLYNVSDPANPVWITSGITQLSSNANANATGELAWHIIDANNAILYAMNTNNGIEAFTVSFAAVPEPCTMLLAGFAGVGLAARLVRRRRA
jgi:hypothetical protein